MIGPLLSLAAGLLTFFLVLLVCEKDRELRKFWVTRTFASVATGLLLWRLTPLWTRWDSVLDNPLLLLSINGGPASVLGGLFAFLGMEGVSLWQARKMRPGTRRRPLVIPVLAGLALVGIWTLAEPLVVPQPGANPGPAVELLVPDLGGQRHALSDWKGKVVVINFWATWCPPCLAELPEFRTYVKTASTKVVVLGVNLVTTEKEGPASVMRFVSKEKMSWTQLTDPEGVLQKAFEVTSIPTTVVLDPDGRVVDRRVGAIDLFWLRTLEARFAR